MTTTQLWRNDVPTFDRLFGDFFAPGTGTTAPSRFSPATDVEETESHYLFSFDVPGMRRDDLRIQFENDVLTVSGERNAGLRNDEKSSVHRAERAYGAFARSFTLPATVDPDGIEASYADGVLRIAVPKAEAAKPRQIKIGEDRKDGFFAKLLNGEGNRGAA